MVNETGKEREQLTQIRPVAAAGDDGTGELLKWGAWTLAVGLISALLGKTLFGGMGPQGPHTNSGWLALIVALMCLPFGCMLSLLGAAKWLRKRRHPRG